LSAEKERSEATTPQQARQQVERLVERFASNLDAYKRSDYKEAHVRVEFIDPFFEALGWDVRNVRGYAEQYKDVVHEDAIKVSGLRGPVASLSRAIERRLDMGWLPGQASACCAQWGDYAERCPHNQ
jgi:hypothetical protein